MEGVANRDQLEKAAEPDALSRRRYPIDVVYAKRRRLAPSVLNRFDLLINGYDLDKLRCEREGDLTCSTSEIQKPPGRSDGYACAQIVKQDLRVRRPETLVILCGSLVQVRLTLHYPILIFLTLAFHSERPKRVDTGQRTGGAA